jgi:ADP-ribosylglycohydrolase
VAEEALGIAVYCALVADDFAHGVLLAANHGGDSDSTASIAGQILGTQLGESVVPEEWIADLEMADVVGRTADELATHAEIRRR